MTDVERDCIKEGLMPRVDENGHPTAGGPFSPLDSGDQDEIIKARERTELFLAKIGDRATAPGARRRAAQ